MLEKLPTISYNQVFGVTDITTPVVVSNTATVDFTVGEGQRADMVADQIYSNDRLDYCVLLANNTINPLDFAAPTYAQFDQRIIDTFGSVATAQQQIMYWQNNWASDDNMISVVGFNSLPKEVSQLYNPVRNSVGTTIGYVRKQLNNRKTTSMYVTYTATNSTLVPKTYVNLMNGQSVVGTGRVIFVSNTIVIVDHVIGNYTCSLISDGVNNSTVSLSGYMPVVLATEAPYYSPVSVYDYLVDQCITQRETIQVYSPADATNIDNTLFDD